MLELVCNFELPIMPKSNNIAVLSKVMYSRTGSLRVVNAVVLKDNCRQICAIKIVKIATVFTENVGKSIMTGEMTILPLHRCHPSRNLLLLLLLLSLPLPLLLRHPTHREHPAQCQLLVLLQTQ